MGITGGDTFMTKNKQTLDFSFKLDQKNIRQDKTEDGDFAFFKGFASTFGNVDHHDDIMLKGSFFNTLKSGRSVRLLWQHNTSQVIGGFTQIEETDEGLLVEGRINLGTQLGKEALALLKAGDIDSMSIGFVTKEASYDADSGIRILKEVDLFEISLVTMPANDMALVTSVKSIDEIETISDVNVILKGFGLSNKQTKKLISKIKGFSQQDAGEEKHEQKEQEAAEVSVVVELINEYNDQIKG